jgi:hypothetical protein
MMAGLEAELELRGDHDEGADASDLHNIALMLESVCRPEQDQDEVERRLRRMARRLVRRHRAVIARTAEMLFAKRTLTAEELDEVAGRSVHDIPVNEANLPPPEIRRFIEPWQPEQ